MKDRAKAATPVSSARVLMLVSALCLSTAGCLGSTLAIQYNPERLYYRLYADFFDVNTTVIRHVHEELWGMYIFGTETRPVSVRSIVERELGGNPDYYVSDLSVHTDMHGTVLFTLIAGMMILPKTTVDFDVVEVRPWRAASGSKPSVDDDH